MKTVPEDLGDPGMNVFACVNWYNCLIGVVGCESPLFGVPGLDLDLDLDLDLLPLGLLALELQLDLGLCGREQQGDPFRERHFLSYSTDDVAGCLLWRVGVLGIDRILDDRLRQSWRGGLVDRYVVFCSGRLGVGGRLRVLLRPLVGLALDARLDPTVELLRLIVRPRVLCRLPSFSWWSCRDSRRAISWNSWGRWLYISIPWVSVRGSAFFLNSSFCLKTCETRVDHITVTPCCVFLGNNEIIWVAPFLPFGRHDEEGMKGVIELRKLWSISQVVTHLHTYYLCLRVHRRLMAQTTVSSYHKIGYLLICWYYCKYSKQGKAIYHCMEIKVKSLSVSVGIQ